MPQYFAVNDSGDGIQTMQPPARDSFYRPFFVTSRLVKCTNEHIQDFYHSQGKYKLFTNEKTAAVEAIKNSGYTDSLGTFAAYPLLIVECQEKISDGSLIDKDKLILLKGKMLHIGNRLVMTLPYQDLDCKDYSSRNSYPSPCKNYPAGFNVKIAMLLFVLMIAVSNELNKKTVDREHLSFSLIAGVAAVLFYFKLSVNKIAEANQKEMDDEIKYQLMRIG